MYERFISSSMLTGTLLAAKSSMKVGAIASGSWRRRSALANVEPPTANCRPLLDVQILHFERVVFDELAPGLDLVTHERREHQVGFHVIFGLDLQQRPLRGIHRRFPERVRVHLAEALVA